MIEPCGVPRIREMDSVAVGPQDREYLCGDLDGGIATETVEMNGRLERMCPRCAEEFVEQGIARRVVRDRLEQVTPRQAVRDSPEDEVAKLNDAANYLRTLAQHFSHKPAVCAWANQCASQLDYLAADVIAGML